MVQLIGNLGAAPDSRTIANADRVATLSLATNFTYKNAKGDRITTTEWHRVIAWRGLAEIATKYLHKGAKLYVQGRIQYRSYEDKEGVTKYTTEIVADELTMRDGASGAGNDDGTDAPEPVDPDGPSEY